jgi:hypothetical protein
VGAMTGEAKDSDIVLPGVIEGDIHRIVNGGLGRFLINEKGGVCVRKGVREERPERGRIPSRAREFPDFRMLVPVDTDECSADFHALLSKIVNPPSRIAARDNSPEPDLSGPGFERS